MTAAPATSGISPPLLESIPKSHELPGAVDHSFPQGTLARRPRAEEPNLTVRLPSTFNKQSACEQSGKRQQSD